MQSSFRSRYFIFKTSRQRRRSVLMGTQKKCFKIIFQTGEYYRGSLSHSRTMYWTQLISKIISWEDIALKISPLLEINHLTFTNLELLLFTEVAVDYQWGWLWSLVVQFSNPFDVDCFWSAHKLPCWPQSRNVPALNSAIFSWVPSMQISKDWRKTIMHTWCERHIPIALCQYSFPYCWMEWLNVFAIHKSLL